MLESAGQDFPPSDMEEIPLSNIYLQGIFDILWKATGGNIKQWDGYKRNSRPKESNEPKTKVCIFFQVQSSFYPSG